MGTASANAELVSRSDFSNLGVSQLAKVIGLTDSNKSASSPVGIRNILFLGANVQMIGIAARPVVTLMQNKHTLGDGTVRNLPSMSVGLLGPPLPPNDAVPIGAGMIELDAPVLSHDKSRLELLCGFHREYYNTGTY